MASHCPASAARCSGWKWPRVSAACTEAPCCTSTETASMRPCIAA